MLRTLNRSDYKKLENTILRLVEGGAKVEVRIVPYYSGTSSTPTQIVFSWRRSPFSAWDTRVFTNN